MENLTTPNNSVNGNSIFTRFDAVFSFGILEIENSVTELFKPHRFLYNPNILLRYVTNFYNISDKFVTINHNNSDHNKFYNIFVKDTSQG